MSVVLHVEDGSHVWVESGAEWSAEDGVEAAGLFPGREGPLARFRRRLVERVVEAGGDREQAELVVAELGDGTLLKLILDNLDRIVEAILKLIGGIRD